MLAKHTLKGKSGCTILTLCLVVGMIFAFGCKKKEQPQVSGQKAPTETTKPAPAPDRVYQPDTAEKINLRILYVGVPNTERAKDFTDFLTEHLAKVETIDYNTFKEDQSTGFDVIILDYDGVGFSAPQPNVSRQYSRATVTVGVPGAFICSSLRLKMGYL